MRFQGKTALVTGAGSGIGRGIALAFAKEGANVVVNDIDLDSARETARLIKASKGSALGLKADVSKSSQVNRMVEAARKKFGRIDILVNNAGGSARERATLFHQSTEEVWDFVIGRNLKGVFICTRAVINDMMKRRYGKIINIASAAAHTGEAGLADYSACKAGVVGFSKVLAKEVSSYGVNVVTVSPGLVETAVFKQLPREQIEARKQDILVKRLGQPEDIASLVLFLASDEASYIVGYNYVIDGGGFL